jgi:hypothetical protein
MKMNRPQTSDLIRAALAAATLLALCSCVAPEPSPAPHFNNPRPAIFVVPNNDLLPYEAIPPSAGRMCLLSSGKCSEMFPEPARPCLLATERCPRDGTFQRIETAPLVPAR